MYWPLIETLLIRSGVILLAGEVLQRLCFRCGAAARFRIRLLSAGLVAMWPLLAFWLPLVEIPAARSAGTGRAIVTVSQTLRLARAGTRSFSLEWLVLAWAAGVVLALVPLAAGSLYMWRVRRRAEPVRTKAWTNLLAELSEALGMNRTPGLVRAQDLAAPATAGVFRPQILLPLGCEDWPETRRRAVLLHELAHVSRRDVPAQIFVQLVAALWWFQPLIWVLRRSLRKESEFACDDRVVASGMLASQYAAELLEVAKGGRGPLLSPVISMVRPRDLERRLEVILRPQPVMRAGRRAAIAMGILTMVALAASATSFGTKQISGRGLLMKRTLISGLLASIGLSAATVSGSLTDITGGAIPNAKILLFSPDTASKLEAVSGADGKFSIPNAPAGDAILRIEKPGFSSVFREFDLKSDSNVDRGLTMQVGAIQQQVTVDGQSTQVKEVTPLSPERLRIGGAMEQSHLIEKKTPVYPSAAKAARIQGKVLLEALISKGGVPQEIRVLSSPSDDLSESALEAVRDWRYTPMWLNGNPIEVLTDITVNYTLSQ